MLFSYFCFMKNENCKYAEIVFPIPVDHAYTYIIPLRFFEDISVGVRALVPFGPRKMTGFVVAIKDHSDYPKLKEIEEILDPVPLFTPKVLELAKWIADYYICGWGEVLKAALPAGINIDSERVIRLIHENPLDLLVKIKARAPRQAQIIQALIEANPLPLSKLKKKMQADVYSSLKALRTAGFVRLELLLPKAKVGKKFDTIVHLSQSLPVYEIQDKVDHIRGQAPRQADVLEFLLANQNQEFTRAEICRRLRTNPSTISSLVEKNLVDLKVVEAWRDFYGTKEIEPPPNITLNPDQQNALNVLQKQIDLNSFSPFLLHGVTGSGKTQVYIEAIHHVLKQNRTAIVLVPEIALTPQMVSRFRSHFQNHVAVFHSRMSPGERYDSWRRTWEGKHQIVIGPRSAIFAPLKNLGLVVIDEEHEPSYKQTDQTPRYSARDIAVVRAFIEKSAIVLGSATPSIESFFNSKVGKYKLLSLPNRIDNVAMPKIDIVNMLKEPRIIGRKEPIIFSRLLRQKIDEKLQKGEQIILFQNRRGFATILKCQSCGYKAECQNCDITLTYHKKGHYLKCHYCGYSMRSPEKCPSCSGLDIFFKGVGTQRVEEELHELFPGVKALRMDLDTTKGKNAHDKILSTFGSGAYNILLGTQMVAKGLDFPNVTLVGVISADTQLFFPDFRAGERTFQLLTQVAGRAGRKDKLGEVVIQTFSPDHYSLIFAKTHDYHNFYNKEVHDRKELVYPPYSRIINILLKGPDLNAVTKTAEAISKNIKPRGQFKMLGPSPAALSKIQGNYRWQILLMSSKQTDAGGELMKKEIKNALSEYKKKNRTKGVTISIDVDPVSIL
jgi:primosomal protein N' (replication factor Y) (superfamily II helicase)